MASVREQLLDYIVDQLNAVTGVTAVRSRLAPVPRSEGTLVIVTWQSETAAEQVMNGVERTLAIKISIVARGEVPDSVADAVAVKVYAKLKGTDLVAGMGGLAWTPIIETGRINQMEEADDGAVDYQMFFEVTYRTVIGDETTQPT